MVQWLSVLVAFAEGPSFVFSTMSGSLQHPVKPIPWAPMPTSSYCVFIHAHTYTQTHEQNNLISLKINQKYFAMYLFLNCPFCYPLCNNGNSCNSLFGFFLECFKIFFILRKRERKERVGMHVFFSLIGSFLKMEFFTLVFSLKLNS